MDKQQQKNTQTENTDKPVKTDDSKKTSESGISNDDNITSSATVGGKKTHWYVVHTYSGHESKVAATLKQRIESQKLQEKILEILLPTQEKIEIREGKKSKVKEKI